MDYFRLSKTQYGRNTVRASNEQIRSMVQEGCEHSTRMERSGWEYSRSMVQEMWEQRRSIERESCEKSTRMERAGC